MAGNSDGARSGWEARWERLWELGDEAKAGPAGQKYLSEKYGETIEDEEPPDYGDYDEYDDYDGDIEY